MTPVVRAHIAGKWIRSDGRYWDGAKWALSAAGASAGALQAQPAVWGQKLRDWVTSSAIPAATLTIGPSDNVSDALKTVVDQAASATGGNPRTRRARLILSPGVYNQALVNKNGATLKRCAFEIIGATGNPADVVIQPGTDIGGLSTFEHGMSTWLLSGITLRRPVGFGNGAVMHGSGGAGIAHEQIIHNCVIDSQNDGGSLSWEVGGNHTAYIADSKINGLVYTHSIISAITPQTPTLLMYDNVQSDYMGVASVADESVHPSDLVLIRSGWHARGGFNIGFQRTGSAANPMFSAQIDPASGITSTNSPRVTFTVPNIAARPILDQNPMMLAYYGTD